MTTRTPPPIDPREWEAQELGLRAARNGGQHPADPEATRYRLVSRAVATAPRSQPPPGFAAALAARAATRGSGLERLLVHILLAVLGAAAVLVTALFAGPAWQATRDSLGAGATPWVAAGAACIVLSWAFNQARQLRALPSRATPH
ncbi:hypothetical protein [Luteimonas sp. A478]